jgi:DMSO reductase family type II enzyme chaperone
MNDTIAEAGTVARAYLAMAQLFSYPSMDVWERLSGAGIVDASLTQEGLEAEYLAAFEMGRDGPPVTLFEGMHRGDLGRDGVLEDLLRYYEFFDVKLSESDREFPDHLVTELEFLAWLSMQEEAAEQAGRDAEPFRNAERDFLTRHLCAWLPVFRQRLEATNTAYAPYGAMLADLVVAHRGWLSGQSQESGDIR